jgi:hypothetical protein
MKKAKKTKRKNGLGRGTSTTPNAPDARAIFIAAVAFERAAQLLDMEMFREIMPKIKAASLQRSGSVTLKAERTDQTTLNLLGPTVVNSAFCVELYLKCLLLRETSHLPWGHNLGELYRSLPLQHRQRIEKLHHEQLRRAGVEPGDDRYDTATILTAEANSFADFRYSFEQPVRELTYSMMELVGPIRRTILAMEPAWSVYAAPYSPAVQVVDGKDGPDGERQ